MDIDETVLDNSPFNAEMLKRGTNYSDETWIEWCELREALAIPGALEFTMLAEKLGVEVFYISNRQRRLLQCTMDNMKALGFPFTDSLHLVLKTDSSSKLKRRTAINEYFDIILLIGDNLGDFDDLFDQRTSNFGKDLVKTHEAPQHSVK